MAEIKILIVEDDSFIAEDMSAKLVKWGYHVVAITDNCKETLEVVEKERPDLIFMDIMISGKEDGIETARKVKELGDFPVIFLSNLYDKATLQRAQSIRPANYLTKPFTENQLLVSIHQALVNITEDQPAAVVADTREKPETMRLRDTVFLRDNNGTFRKHEISDILYLEADRAYCTVHTRTEKLVQSANMTRVKDAINHPALIQVSRSFVVNIQCIDQVKGNLVVVAGTEIKIGDQFRDLIFNQLNLVK